MRRKTALIAALALAAFPAAAGAAPVLNLEIRHAQANFPPGGAPATPRVVTQTQGSASVNEGVNEEQQVVVPASKGKFNLCFDPDAGGPAAAQCTPNLAFDASTATVQAALRALPAIGSPSVDVTSQFFRTYDVVFTGDLAKTNVPTLEAASAAAPDDLRRGPELWFDVANVGPVPTSGPLTLTVKLPAGITRNSVRFGYGELDPAKWSCPGFPGDSTVTCTGPGSIPRHRASQSIIVLLDVNPAFSPGTLRTATATVSGGGATGPPAAACAGAPWNAPSAAACDAEPITIDPTPAGFGILPASFTPDFLSADGVTPQRGAGARPELLDVPFDFTTVDHPETGDLYFKAASEPIHDLSVDLPPGFLADPTAVGECSAAAFAVGACPRSSQVGFIELKTQTLESTVSATTGVDSLTLPVFNLIHPGGVLNDLAFTVISNPVHLRSVLDPAAGYAITTEVPDINETFDPFSQKLTLWGVPADPVHDFQRCAAGRGLDTAKACPSDGPLSPFLTMPFQCGADMSMRFHRYDSWQHIGDYGEPIDRDLGQFSDCDQIPFEPSVSIAPTTNAADSPSGLDLQIDLPQHEGCDPGPPVGCEIATSPLRDATVTLPAGLTVNPASANGLDACTPAQISLGTNAPVTCPDGSKVASVQVTTPALPDPVAGTVYLATPHNNPFDSLLAGYIVFSDPDRGLLVKIPGEITADPASGQLTGTFEENPQLPFSQFQLHFKGGAHSTLITPKACGNYSAAADFSPWSGNADVAPTSQFAIVQSPGGGSCPASEAELPNSPGFDAGPISPVSKSYSPFVLHLRRQDGSQRFGAFNVTLPQGLTGKLAGTALCSDAALTAAEAKSGRAEQASPSCPAASHLGEVVAAVGAGPSPYHAKGEAYLAGPYKGAPVSLAVLTPALAGPFDLGTIVIRTPLRVDPATAQITAVSDPIPQMLEGIPTDIRSVDVIMDRPQFTLTGTSCDPSQVGGLLTSTLGQSVPLAVRYQLSDCNRLPFKPKISLSLRGDTKRGGHPALTVVLQTRPQDANIASLQLAMPHAEFLDQAHIKTVCTRVQFAADACPPGAVYGQATVITPLLDYPLSGNVYLRSSNNLLPDVVPDLRGPAYQPLKVEASGRTDSIHGGIRNTFDFVPDAPFTKLVTKLPGAKKGLFENSRDICARTYNATVKYSAHNGLTYTDHPELSVKGCKGKARKGRAKHHHGGKHHRAVR
jgi:hypothetical protein